MTSKEIFDHLCLTSEIRYTHKITSWYHADVVISQATGLWLVKQTCNEDPFHSYLIDHNSEGIQQYIKSHRAEISRSLTEGRNNCV